MVIFHTLIYCFLSCIRARYLIQKLTNQEFHLHIVLLFTKGPVKFDDDGELFIPAHNEAGTLVLVRVVVFFVLCHTHVNAQH